MARKYFSQEKDFSCGASAVRNILAFYKIDVSESYLRTLCETNKSGTTECGMMNGLEHYNLSYKEFETKSSDVFRRKLIKGLKKGSPFILLTDSNSHWICALEYKLRKIKIVDSMFAVANKSIVQWLTMKQLINMAHNYDKIKDRKYFYLMEVNKDG